MLKVTFRERGKARQGDYFRLSSFASIIYFLSLKASYISIKFFFLYKSNNLQSTEGTPFLSTALFKVRAILASIIFFYLRHG